MSQAITQIFTFPPFQALKPKVKLGCGKELVCKEGETVTVFAEVAGEPPADDIKWSISGTELVNDAKNGVLIDNSKEYKSKLQIDAVARKHEGKCFEHFKFHPQLSLTLNSVSSPN